VPLNFVVTAERVRHHPGPPRRCGQPAQAANPQTDALLDALGLPHVITSNT
jgi:hypothetical protein